MKAIVEERYIPNIYVKQILILGMVIMTIKSCAITYSCSETIKLFGISIYYSTVLARTGNSSPIDWSALINEKLKRQQEE